MLGGELAVTHAPKTIDNDLPLPPRGSDVRLHGRVGKDLVCNLIIFVPGDER